LKNLRISKDGRPHFSRKIKRAGLFHGISPPYHAGGWGCGSIAHHLSIIRKRNAITEAVCGCVANLVWQP
jgi:hypothetical protein